MLSFWPRVDQIIQLRMFSVLPEMCLSNFCLPGLFSFISFAYGFNINERSHVSREQ